MVQDVAPTILTGNQRSGTTFLGGLLADQTEGSFGNEDGVIRLAITWFHHLSDKPELLPYARFNEFIRLLAIRPEPRYEELSTDIGQRLYRRFVDGGLDFKTRSADVRQFIRELAFDHHAPVAERSQLHYWGDKYPEYCFVLDQLLDVFPGVRFIFLVRHPYSCIEAHARRLEDVKRNFGKAMLDLDDAVIQWKVWNERWLSFQHQIDPTNRLIIRYEQLIASPDATIGKLGTFLGIDLLASSAYEQFRDEVDENKLNAHRESPLFDDIVRSCKEHELEPTAEAFGYRLD